MRRDLTMPQARRPAGSQARRPAGPQARRPAGPPAPPARRHPDVPDPGLGPGAEPAPAEAILGDRRTEGRADGYRRTMDAIDLLRDLASRPPSRGRLAARPTGAPRARRPPRRAPQLRRLA